jgi:hypothetical protein
LLSRGVARGLRSVTRRSQNFSDRRTRDAAPSAVQIQADLFNTFNWVVTASQTVGGPETPV